LPDGQDAIFRTGSKQVHAAYANANATAASSDGSLHNRDSLTNVSADRGVPKKKKRGGVTKPGFEELETR
jgi:hypothetical protein